MSTNKIYAECINSNGGGTEVSVVCGNPPKACRSFTCEFDDDNDVLKFKWEDVDNDFWGGCRLVVKQGSAPENAEDGDIIIDTYELNKYKVNPLEVPIEDSGTYYATLFPFNTSGIMNSLKVNAINLSIVNTKDPVSFEKDDWDMIKRVLSEHKTSTYYHVGDTKPLTCSDGNTYTMEITSISNNSGSTPDTMELEAKELCPTPLSTMVEDKTFDIEFYYSVDESGESVSIEKPCTITLPSYVSIFNGCQSPYDILPENIKTILSPITAQYLRLNYKLRSKNSGSNNKEITMYVRELDQTNVLVNISLYNPGRITPLKYIVNTTTYGSYIYNYIYTGSSGSSLDFNIDVSKIIDNGNGESFTCPSTSIMNDVPVEAITIRKAGETSQSQLVTSNNSIDFSNIYPLLRFTI